MRITVYYVHTGSFVLKMEEICILGGLGIKTEDIVFCDASTLPSCNTESLLFPAWRLPLITSWQFQPAFW